MSLDLGLLILRVTVGLLFVGHGAQKLFGWFGGHGIAGTAGWLESMGLRPGRLWAQLAGWTELVGGALVALGFLTPLGPLAILAVMLMAIEKVHASKGLWITNGGYEYNLVLIAVAVVIGLAGSGAYALDALLGLQLPIVPIFWFGLAVIVGVLLVNHLRGSQPRGHGGRAPAAR